MSSKASECFELLNGLVKNKLFSDIDKFDLAKKHETKNTAEDNQKALKIMQNLVFKRRYQPAYAELGQYYQNGLGVMREPGQTDINFQKKNLNRALSVFKKGIVETQCIICQTRFVYIILTSKIMEFNPQVKIEALHQLIELEKSENGMVLFNLGKLFYKFVDPINKKRAVKLFELAIAKGCYLAANMLGNHYSNDKLTEICPDAQDPKLTYDLKKSCEYYKLAAEQGISVAQINYASCLTNGEGTAVNFDEALKWFRKVEGSNDPHLKQTAAYNMGMIYSLRRERKADDYLSRPGVSDLSAFRVKQIISIFQAQKKSSSPMHPDAEKTLFIQLLEFDQIVSTTNHIQALPVNKEIIGSIYFALGMMYFEGKGTEKDKVAGLVYLEKSAQLANEEAISWLYYYYDSKDEKEKVAQTLVLMEKEIDKNDSLAILFAVNLIFGENPKKGVKILLREKLRNNSLALNLLGICSMKGMGIKLDFVQAEKHFKAAIAASEGRDDRIPRLNLLCLKMLSQAHEEKVRAEVFTGFEALASEGSEVSRLYFAFCNLVGFGTKIDLNKAIELFIDIKKTMSVPYFQLVTGLQGFRFLVNLKEISQNIPVQLCNLGLCYLMGWGVNKDLKMAIEYLPNNSSQFCRSLNQPEINDEYLKILISEFPPQLKALYLLNYIQLDAPTTPREIRHEILALSQNASDLKSHLEWVFDPKVALDLDYKQQFKLGFCFLYGYRIKQDIHAGISLLSQLVDKVIGRAEAENAEELQFAVDTAIMLGLFCKRGEHVNKDIPQAIALMNWAAMKGSSQAQVYLAHLYEDTFNEEDPVEHRLSALFKIFELYQKAAKQNDPDGLNDLARCYAGGVGTDVDHKKAYELFFQANKLRHERDPDILINLAECYAYGEGIKQNQALAMDLFHRAKDIFIKRKQYSEARNIFLQQAEVFKEGQRVAQDLKAAEEMLNEAEKIPNDDPESSRVRAARVEVPSN